MTISICPLSASAPASVEALLDRAFGTDRHLRTAYRIREGMTAIDALSFAALSDDELVGSLQCWPVALDAAPLVLVGPVAVDPAQQRGGVGRRLMTHLINVAPETAMVLIGDPEYYGRFFGFTAEATAEWAVPGPVERQRLLARNVATLPATGTLGPRAFATTGINA